MDHREIITRLRGALAIQLEDRGRNAVWVCPVCHQESSANAGKEPAIVHADDCAWDMPIDTNPWFNFLHYRRNLINAWRLEGKSCEDIVRLLAMDVGQVWLISQVETGPAPDSVVRNIEDVKRRGLAALEATIAADERQNRLDAALAALSAFVRAWERSLQLEKTDVALRAAKAVLAGKHVTADDIDKLREDRLGIAVANAAAAFVLTENWRREVDAALEGILRSRL